MSVKCFVITGADILTIFDDILSIPVALLLSRLVKIYKQNPLLCMVY